jgi:hypothetical protein
MPAQKCSRGHEQRPLPRLPRQRQAERHQERPIRLARLCTSDLTLQYPKLMTEQQDLDLLLPLRATAQYRNSSSRRSDQYRNDREIPCERRATIADPNGQARTSPSTPIHGATEFSAPTR